MIVRNWKPVLSLFDTFKTVNNKDNKNSQSYMLSKKCCGWVCSRRSRSRSRWKYIPVDNNATLWLHLASRNLPDFQHSFKSKMEPSVAIIPSYLINIAFQCFTKCLVSLPCCVCSVCFLITDQDSLIFITSLVKQPATIYLL